ncbi:hypothetical protein G9A89_004689 [Geosiphon pyriformis]|nr:hypothetical protein G9A89_004689 [Geosiphon pyriformis]
MPDWKSLLKRPLSLRKKKNKEPKESNKSDTHIVKSHNNYNEKTSNGNGEETVTVTHVKKITTTDESGHTETQVITYTTEEPLSEFQDNLQTTPHEEVDSTYLQESPHSHPTSGGNHVLHQQQPPTEQKFTSELNRNDTNKNDVPTNSHKNDAKQTLVEDQDPVSQSAPIVTKNFVKHFNSDERDFTKVDHHARNTPSLKTKDIVTLSHHLTSPFPITIDKLRAIYTWIAENIEYDVKALFSGKIHHMEASEVLSKRLAVCDGYGELFNALAKEAKLDTWKISGHAKGAGYSPGADIDSFQFAHAWNGTCVDGEYLLIDSTWGAGVVEGQSFVQRFDPFYFLVTPSKFIYSHLPRKEEEQYLEPPLNKTQFVSLPFVKPPYFTAGLSFITKIPNEIEVDHDKLVFEIERTHPDESKALHAHLAWNGQQVPVFIQRLGGHGKSGGRLYRFHCEIPSKGEGKLNIFVLLNGNQGPLASQLLIRNRGSGTRQGPFVTTFSVPFSFTIINPIHATLKYNSKQVFELVIFDQEESTLPQFCLFTPGKDTQMMKKVEQNLTDGSIKFAIETTLDERGKWNLTYMRDEETLDFIAQYTVQ